VGSGVVADEPFRGAFVGGCENIGTRGPNHLSLSIVDIMWSVPSYAGMAMLGVIPTEEALAEVRAYSMLPNVSADSRSVMSQPTA
jgi:hypothetical protein